MTALINLILLLLTSAIASGETNKPNKERKLNMHIEEALKKEIEHADKQASLWQRYLDANGYNDKCELWEARNNVKAHTIKAKALEEALETILDAENELSPSDICEDFVEKCERADEEYNKRQEEDKEEREERERDEEFEQKRQADLEKYKRVMAERRLQAAEATT